MARDIQRHLHNEPVVARRPTHLYRFQKLVRRNNLVFAVASAATIALLFGTVAVLSLWSGCRVEPTRRNLTGDSLRGTDALEANPSRAAKLTVRVVSSDGAPIEGVSCELIVGGFPSDERGLPRQPPEGNTLTRITDATGEAVFSYRELSSKRSILHLAHTNYMGATRFLEGTSDGKSILKITLYKPLRVILRYAFQPGEGDSNLLGSDLTVGRVALFPMEDGSYRPPARAHFSFNQNQIVGSSGVLDLGIAIDQRDGKLYFGESNGRFDHCTDLGNLEFENLSAADPSRLERKRADTLIVQGHTYVYESNIYPPAQRTEYTGFGVFYAKIFVDSIDPGEKLTR